LLFIDTAVPLTPSPTGTTPGMEEVERSSEPESRGLGDLSKSEEVLNEPVRVLQC